MPLDSPTDSHLYLPPKNILCIYRYLMGCIWCICFFLKHLYLLGAFEGRLQSQLSNNIDSGSTIQHPKVSFLTWNSMKFPDHKTRIIPRKLRKQPKKHTHTKKKKEQRTNALHVGWLYVLKCHLFEKKMTSRVSDHSCKQPPMSLHEMRPVLVPFVAPAGASPLRCATSVVTYFLRNPAPDMQTTCPLKQWR